MHQCQWFFHYNVWSFLTIFFQTVGLFHLPLGRRCVNSVCMNLGDHDKICCVWNSKLTLCENYPKCKVTNPTKTSSGNDSVQTCPLFKSWFNHLFVLNKPVKIDALVNSDLRKGVMLCSDIEWSGWEWNSCPATPLTWHQFYFTILFNFSNENALDVNPIKRTMMNSFLRFCLFSIYIFVF